LLFVPTGTAGIYDVFVSVRGGGLSGQASSRVFSGKANGKVVVAVGLEFDLNPTLKVKASQLWRSVWPF